MKKEKPPFCFIFFNFFDFWGAFAPPTPLSNVDVFIFVLTCASGLILEKKDDKEFGLLLIY